MKKLLWLSALLSTISVAEPLHNYEQIKAAVMEGKYIRLVVNYPKCSAPEGKFKVPNNYAIETPNALAITTEGSIGTYILYFTMYDPQFPLKPVYQYVRYKINKDNTLQMLFADLNAADYAPLGVESSITCKIDDGVTVFSNQQHISEISPSQAGHFS